ncbi:MAG: hypothetical protein HY744_17310 [Deltaproteobacteria bacterium]|nr:hypothetical protein [Deltaproteobacteria bacterium]
MACSHRAVLIVTCSVQGTSSNLAKRRVDLRCGKPAGHDGPHSDAEHGESWEDRGCELTHVLRHEDGD